MAQYRIHFVFIDPSPTGHHSWVHPLFWYCFNHLGYRIITMMWRFCVQGSVFLPVCHLDILRGNAWQSLDVSRWNKTSSSSTRIFFFSADKQERQIQEDDNALLFRMSLVFFFLVCFTQYGSASPLAAHYHLCSESTSIMWMQHSLEHLQLLSVLSFSDEVRFSNWQLIFY